MPLTTSGRRSTASRCVSTTPSSPDHRRLATRSHSCASCISPIVSSRMHWPRRRGSSGPLADRIDDGPSRFTTDNMHLGRITLSTLLILAGGCATATRGSPAPDSPMGTIVVSNMQDNTATLVDASSGRVLATVPTGEGPHEVATTHDGRWALVTNYGIRGKPGNSVTVIDVAAAAVSRTISLGQYSRPHGMAVLPGDTIFAVTSEASQAVVLVDFRNGQVLRAIPTKGRGSHMIALPTAAAELFTTNIPDGSVSRLDLRGGDSTRVVKVA